MKKIFASIMTLLFGFACFSIAECATPSANAKHIGVIIIGDSDFKTKDCYRYAKNKLNPQKNPNIVIESGDDVQSKYMEYWAGKGFLQEQELTEADMLAFAEMSGYDNVIYLMPFDFTSADQFDYSKSFLDYLFFGAGVGSQNVSMAFAAVFCDKDNIIKKYSTVEDYTKYNDSNGTTMGKGQHKYNLFRRCVSNFGAELTF